MTLSAEVRRLVTYVNEDGKAVALFDGDNPHKRVRPGAVAGVVGIRLA